MIAAWMAYALVIATLVSVAALIARANRDPAPAARVAGSGWRPCCSSLCLPMLFAWHGARSERSAGDNVGRAGRTRQTSGVRTIADRMGRRRWRSCRATRHIGRVAACRMGSHERARARDAGDGMVATQTTVAICHRRRSERRERQGHARRRAGGGRHHSPANRGSAMAAAAGCETQAIVIAHEREHVRAQDIRVLGGALLVAVLLPWNLPAVVAAAQAAFCDGSRLRCARAARRAIAVRLTRPCC